jgi:hypothetical protein
VKAWAAIFVLLPLPALAQHSGGDAQDRLDAPGTPTDRYLSTAEVREVLHAGTDAFFQCFREHLRTRKQAEVDLSFAVSREGRAERVLVSGAELPAPFVPCIEAAAVALPFPTHDGDLSEFSYPLVFVADAKGARVLPYPVVFTKPRPLRLPLLRLPPDLPPGDLLLLERLVHPPASSGTAPVR